MKTLIAYFSAEGHTKKAAKIVADKLNADLFEIKPKIKYTKKDLDWTDKNSRSSVEMKDESCRPEILENLDISAYKTVIIGFPIWWYIEPRIIDTFLSAHDFSDKKVILFATSGGSGISGAVKRIKSFCPDVLENMSKLVSVNSAGSWAENLKSQLV